MPELSADDKKKIEKSIKELMTTAQSDTRKYDDIVKLAGSDKDYAKLAKAANDAYKAAHKAGRALLDFVNSK